MLWARRGHASRLYSLGAGGLFAVLAILRKIILLIPFIYILPALFTENKVYAVFAAEPVADVLAVCCTVAYFFATFNKRLKKREALLKGGGAAG